MKKCKHQHDQTSFGNETVSFADV